MSTEEKNCLIATFMGGKISKHPAPQFGNMGYSFKKKICNSSWWAIDALKYHTSWDWIMPVCKKLDFLSEDKVIPHSKEYEKLCDKLDNEVTRFYDIKTIFPIVIEFIKWYNQQPKPLQP